MKVKINHEEREFRTVWMEEMTVNFIDQTKLPEKFEIFKSESSRETARAIRTMIVRGAPAIGVTAAYGMVQACLEAEIKTTDFDKFLDYVGDAARVLKETRPTAVDLFKGTDRVLSVIRDSKEPKEATKRAIDTAKNIAEENIEACRQIGELGNELVTKGDKLLTHCNAGALGCVDYGTALSVIRFAHYAGKNIFVFVDETRPRLQGELTAWELNQEGIKHAIIVDNAAGHFLREEIDLVVVGADRIALNGDVANKIGTYEKAVVAKETGVPFYVAAPTTTIDLKCKSGREIPIEERDQREVLFIDNHRISPPESEARNPAFDVTPAKYITGIITEKGIMKPKEIKKLIIN